MKAKQRAPALRRWATRRFGCEQRRLQSNFVAAEPPGTEDHVQRAGNPGNVGLLSRARGTGDQPLVLRLNQMVHNARRGSRAIPPLAPRMLATG